MEKEERRGRQADSEKGRRNAKESREGRRMDRRRDGRMNRWTVERKIRKEQKGKNEDSMEGWIDD